MKEFPKIGELVTVIDSDTKDEIVASVIEHLSDGRGFAVEDDFGRVHEIKCDKSER